MLDKSVEHIGVIMVKNDPENYPVYTLPEGFTICGYRSGFEKQWSSLMFEVGQCDSLDEASALFKKEFLWIPHLLSTQCLFVLDNIGDVAACASIWHGEHFGETFQRIHWVATKEMYQGKGLVKALMTELLRIYNNLGDNNFIYLTSQTWSYRAVNLYTKFGFEAYLGEKPLNWKSENFKEENTCAWEIINSKISTYQK